MATIINFAKGNTSSDDEIFVVKPDFDIDGYKVTIDRNGDNSFRISVGCRSVLISYRNLGAYLKEAELQPIPEETKRFIIQKDKSNPTSTSAVFKEASPTYFISLSGKVYPKANYKCVDKTYTPKAKYFSKRDNIHINVYLPNDDHRIITNKSFELVKHILNVIKDYYVSKNIKF